MDEAVKKPLKRCISCGSKRVRVITPSKVGELLEGVSERLDGGDQARDIYRTLSRIRWITVHEQEAARRRLRKLGVHILCLDDRLRLGDVLTRREVEAYLSLIKAGGFGLAVIDHIVVAVAPNSPVRVHVGVNPVKLKELLSAADQP